jgi:hypothetical protein
MAFESKRLRVQLPCKKAGTLVEKEVDPEAARIRNPECMIFGSRRFPPPINCGFPSPQPCVFCTWVSPHCRFFDSPIPNCREEFHTAGCAASEALCRNHVTCGITDACATGTQACGPPTLDPGTDPIVVDPDPEDPGAVLLRPEDLGRFRRQLQAELEGIEALEERRGEIEGQLKELASAEKALKKRSKDK